MYYHLKVFEPMKKGKPEETLEVASVPPLCPKNIIARNIINLTIGA